MPMSLPPMLVLQEGVCCQSIGLTSVGVAMLQRLDNSDDLDVLPTLLVTFGDPLGSSRQPGLS